MSMLSCYNNNVRECENSILKSLEYNLNILKGFIIQVYYFTNLPHLIDEKDKEICSIAFQYEGKVSHENSCFGEDGRRDIDFVFTNNEKAILFKNHIKKLSNYWLHSQPHSGGINLNIVDIDLFIKTRNDLIYSWCGKKYKVDSQLNKPVQIIPIQ